MRKRAILYVLAAWLGCSATAWGGLDGVWKDVPLGSSEDRIVAFLQTTTEGSAVLIVLDHSGLSNPGSMFAFIDPDYTNGINAMDVSGKDVAVYIPNFVDESSCAVTLRVGTDASAFTLYQWFQAPEPSTRPLNGIYKDAPKPGTSPFSVYLQTYFGEAPVSAIAVVTPDAGESYYAFLDAEVFVDFEAEDILGSGARLSILFEDAAALWLQGTAYSAAGDSSPHWFQFQDSKGKLYAGDLHLWFQGPDGIRIKSNAFDHGNMIPAKYTADGVGLSPPVNWFNAPPGTRSYVVIVEDITASNLTHWIVYDIPSDVVELMENADSSLPAGAKHGINGATQLGYLPMDPPPQSGVHQYFFRIYALSVTTLNIAGMPTRGVVESSMQGKVLDSAQIFGTYVR